MPTEISHISFTEYKADSRAIIALTMMDQMYLIFFFTFLALVWLKNPQGNFKYSSSDLILPNLIKTRKQTVIYFHTAIYSCQVLTEKQKEFDSLGVINPNSLHQGVLQSLPAVLRADLEGTIKVLCHLHFNIRLVYCFLSYIVKLHCLCSWPFPHSNSLQFYWLDSQQKGI